MLRWHRDRQGRGFIVRVGDHEILVTVSKLQASFARIYYVNEIDCQRNWLTFRPTLSINYDEKLRSGKATESMQDVVGVTAKCSPE